jgi:hypothetical protein
MSHPLESPWEFVDAFAIRAMPFRREAGSGLVVVPEIDDAEMRPPRAFLARRI